MRTAAIILARLSSQRLPRKALRELAGRPLLQYVIDRARRSRADEVVLATSDEGEDEPLVEYARRNDLRVVRGPLRDVARRTWLAAREVGAEVLLRVNGDSPWVDPDLLDHALARLEREDVDLVTNVFPRSFPTGVSVEAMRAQALGRAVELMTEDADREHVTRYFYRHPEAFRIVNLSSGRPWSDLHFAVDTPRDLRLASRLAAAMERPHVEYTTEEIVGLYQRLTDGDAVR